MAKKRRQHYVPKVYLKAFESANPPDGWPRERPYTPTVWVIHPSLEEDPRRRSSSRILWENSLYTLSSDDPHRPGLEEALGRLESAYAPVRGRILQRQPLSVEDYGILCLFVGAMFGRVPGQLQHWQEQLANLERLTRKLSDEPPAGISWDWFLEAGKYTLPGRIQAYAEVVGPHGFILLNGSRFPLITSDRPVTHVFLHPDESPNIHFPQEVREQLPPSAERFFCFMPLSPEATFVSSPLLKCGEHLYLETGSDELIFSLNQYTRHRAQEVISRYPRPYGALTNAVIRAEQEARASFAPKTGILIYTRTSRHWIEASMIERGRGGHPLHGRLKFVAFDQAELRAACTHEYLVELRLIQRGNEMGGMRDGWFSSIGLYDDEPSIIENWPGGWEAWRDYKGEVF